MSLLLENTFIHQIGKSVQLIADGPGRYRVSVPFTFNDGDALVIVLKQAGTNGFCLTKAIPICILAYSIEASRLQYGTRRQMIVQALQMFQVQERRRRTGTACRMITTMQNASVEFCPSAAQNY